MRHLTQEDLLAWLAAITDPHASASGLLKWLDGPLKDFFPYKGVVLGHGELLAGQLTVTHMLASGHDAGYLQQISTTFDLAQRGSLQWWFANRQPFFIDPHQPPPYASAFEIEEIEEFGLRNVAGHGVLNVKSNAGTYFGFSGVEEPLSAWHVEALRILAPVLNDLFLAHIAQANVPSPRQGPCSASFVEQLTPREKSIVRQLAGGACNKQIGKVLGISEKTVRNQLAAIYARIGVRKRAELIVLLR